jgi:pimeloyl-ACP methyl ester carboxylesterase
MALPALVLVHGGGLAADSWELAIDVINQLDSELTVLAVDLPGRRGKPGDLFTLTLADWVQSVVDDIEDAGLTKHLPWGSGSPASTGCPGPVASSWSARCTRNPPEYWGRRCPGKDCQMTFRALGS